jgi:conjugal transfer pilus assembly protein TraB
LQRLQNTHHPAASDIPPLPGEETTAPPAPMSPAFPKVNLPPPPEPIRIGPVPSKPVAPSTAPADGIFDINVAPDTGKAVSPDSDKSAKSAPQATVHDTLPTGAFTGAVLLNGLDAPTGGLAKTNPIPVLMHLLDNGALPNGFRSRVRDCFATGAGYGDLSSERAYIRLETLSCVMKSGDVIDTPVEGFIAGEDGKNGLRGTVVSKQGQLIARALFAGIAAGLGQSISQSYSTVSTSALGAVQTVDPDKVFQAGAATGVGKALEKIADFYIARANELYPVVEVDSGRRGDVVLTKKVSLGPAFNEAWSDE